MNDIEKRKVEMLRRQIDELDLEILNLLNRRANCALDIGTVKRRRGWQIYDPERETTIVRRVLESNSGPLEADAVRRLFERILDESRRLERLANDTHEPAGPERRS